MGVTTQVAVQWWDNPTCDFGGTATGGTSNTHLETAGSWVDVQGSNVAPMSMQAGLMRIGYATPASGTSGAEVIRYDQVFVPKPSGGLSAGSTLLVLGAFGLAASRKTPRVREAIPIRRSLPFRTRTRPSAAACGFVPEAGA